VDIEEVFDSLADKLTGKWRVYAHFVLLDEHLGVLIEEFDTKAEAIIFKNDIQESSKRREE